MICVRCGKEREIGALFERVDGDKDFECSECHPVSQTYRNGPGRLNDYLPGGKKYQGAQNSTMENATQ
jgi:hypothetical protein